MSNHLKAMKHIGKILKKIKEIYKQDKVPTSIFISHDVLQLIIKTEEFKKENLDMTQRFKLYGTQIYRVSLITEELENYIEVI